MLELELERAIWRHECGYWSRDQLVARMREAYAQTGGNFAALGGDIAVLRRWNRAMIHEFDEARHAADEALIGTRYREALRHIRRARAVVDDARVLLGADAALHAAAAATARLYALVSPAALRALPTLKSLAEWVESVERRMTDQRYRQASLLGALCVRQVLALEARIHDEPASIEQQVTALQAVCDETRDALQDESSDPSQDGTFDALRALLVGGYLPLAGRLAAELGGALTARRRLWVEFRRERDEAGAAGDAEALKQLAEIVRHTPIDHAADELTRRRLDTCIIRLEAQQARLHELAIGFGGESRTHP